MRYLGICSDRTGNLSRLYEDVGKHYRENPCVRYWTFIEARLKEKPRTKEDIRDEFKASGMSNFPTPRGIQRMLISLEQSGKAKKISSTPPTYEWIRNNPPPYIAEVGPLSLYKTDTWILLYHGGRIGQFLSEAEALTAFDVEAKKLGFWKSGPKSRYKYIGAPPDPMGEHYTQMIPKGKPGEVFHSQ